VVGRNYTSTGKMHSESTKKEALFHAALRLALEKNDLNGKPVRLS